MSDSPRGLPQPTNITLHQASKLLSIEYDDGQKFDLSCEFLRVWTPSADARGHSPGQEVLQVGKRNVSINSIEPVGNYAIRLIFSDGHDTGLYSWDTLYEFGLHREELWQAYLDKLASAGASREPDSAGNIMSSGSSCGSGGCGSSSGAPSSSGCGSGGCSK